MIDTESSWITMAILPRDSYLVSHQPGLPEPRTDAPVDAPVDEPT